MFMHFDIGNTRGRDNGDRCSDWSRRHGNGLCTVIRARTHLGFRRFRRGTPREFSASINRRRLSSSPPGTRCLRCGIGKFLRWVCGFGWTTKGTCTYRWRLAGHGCSKSRHQPPSVQPPQATPERVLRAYRSSCHAQH